MSALVGSNRFHPDNLFAEESAAIHSRPQPDNNRISERDLRLRAIKKWRGLYPLLLEYNDWKHPELAQNRAAIDKMLGWRPGNEWRGMFLTRSDGAREKPRMFRGYFVAL